MDPTALQNLPLEERLRQMEALWDSICRDSGDTLASPRWHAEVIAERRRLLDAGAERTSDWTSAKRRLRAAAGEA